MTDTKKPVVRFSRKGVLLNVKIVVFNNETFTPVTTEVTCISWFEVAATLWTWHNNPDVQSITVERVKRDGR